VQYKTHTNRTPTGTSKGQVYDITSIHTYTYEHSHHKISWRLSACANSVYQALFLLPLCAWVQGYPIPMQKEGLQVDL